MVDKGMHQRSVFHIPEFDLSPLKSCGEQASIG